MTDGAVTLNHFGVYALTAAFHALPAGERQSLGARWLQALGDTARRVHSYRTFPTTADSDLIVWSVVPVADGDAAGRFFTACAGALRPLRRWVRPVAVLWGFTRPSEYSRARRGGDSAPRRSRPEAARPDLQAPARSRQAIDPFAARTLPYLVVYPFAKTAEWYLLDAAVRQELMNEHMRIGKQYTDVQQQLLYSTGLQDHEFVVVYETPDLARFSQLVAELRRTEARRYTKSDAPVRVGVHLPDEEQQAFWS